MKKLKLLIIIFMLFSIISLNNTNSFAFQISKYETKIDTPIAIKGINVFQAGDFFIGGQPTIETLRWMASNGVTIVINTRTIEEMESFNKQNFNEADSVMDLGMIYVNIPLGRKAGYSAEKVNVLDQTLKNNQGKVFIHCRSGSRVTILLTAYLVKFRNFSIDSAINLSKKMNPRLDKFNKSLNMLLPIEK